MSEIGHITEPAILERLPQPVLAMAKNFPDGSAIAPHSHRSAQLVYASEGVMTLSTAGGAFVVPPQRAVWVPPGIEHSIAMRGPLAMRTLYVKRRAPGLAGRRPCRRGLPIVAGTDIDGDEPRTGVRA